MKTTSWPSTFQSEEKSIPFPSHNPDDLLVELRIRTSEGNSFFEKVIADHPHFCVVRERDGKVPSPDLIIIEAGFDHHPTFSFIESMTQHAGGPDFFLTSEVQDVNLGKKAFQLGVKEFFPIPLDLKTIMVALDRYAVEKGKKAKKRRTRVRDIISFLGARGGIGTTTTVVNLGMSLQQMKDAPSVVILELNQQAGDIELFLDTKLPHTLRELGSTICPINETTLNQFLVKHDSGLHFLSSGNTEFLVKGLRSEWIAPIISSLRSRFDFVLIDCGHNLDTNTTTALGYSSRIIVVSTLTIPVVKRTKLVLEFLLRAGIPAEKIQWVLNRYTQKESSLLKEAEEICGHKTSWTIPNDFQRANQAVNSGCPLTIEAPKSAIAKSFLPISSYLLANPDAATTEHSKVQEWVNRIWAKL